MQAKVVDSRRIGTIIRSVDRRRSGAISCSQVVVAGVTALLLSYSPSNFVPRSLYNSVLVGVVLYSQCIALVLVLTDFIPYSICS